MGAWDLLSTFLECMVLGFLHVGFGPSCSVHRGLSTELQNRKPRSPRLE